MNSLEDFTVPELLHSYSQIHDEFRKRGILRSENLLGDYTEWLVAGTLGLVLSSKSTAGFDALDGENMRYQIKGRRPTLTNKSTQLGAIRNLDKRDFDFLIGCLFHIDFTPRLVVKVPYVVVAEVARYRAHGNEYILHLQGSWLSDARVKDITGLFYSA